MVVTGSPNYKDEAAGEPLIGWTGQRLAYLASLAGIVTLDEAGKSAPEIRLIRDEALQSIRRESVIMCRLPRNTKVTPKETANCAPYLLDTIATHLPQVIISLGTPAMKWFAPADTLASSHGWPHRWEHPNGTMMIHVAMHHPYAAYPSYIERAKVMEIDWWYLGETLAGRAPKSHAEFLKRRMETHAGDRWG